MKLTEPNVHRWDRSAYYRLADVGILHPDERVELIEGVVYTKHPRPEPRRWTKDEYYRMAALGLFDGIHVELIEGRIIEMSPQLSPHAATVGIVARALEVAFGPGCIARRQTPIDLGESEPEPDVAIVVGSDRDYVAAHPKTARLVVEVSESSLSYDRNDKASLYARAGIADYWIVNLQDRQLEVHRNPVGDTYADVTILREADSVTPLAAPQATIAVADLLP